jgi:hypothetical protein
MAWVGGAGSVVQFSADPRHWCGYCCIGVWESGTGTLVHRPGCQRPGDDQQQAAQRKAGQ